MTDHTITPTTTHEHPSGSPLPELLRRVADELHTAITDGLTVPHQISVRADGQLPMVWLSFAPMTADQTRVWTERVDPTAAVERGMEIHLHENFCRPYGIGPHTPAPVGTRALADQARDALRTAADCLAAAVDRGLILDDNPAVFLDDEPGGKVQLFPPHGDLDQLRGWVELIGADRGDHHRHKPTGDTHVWMSGRFESVRVSVYTCGPEDLGLPEYWTLTDLTTTPNATDSPDVDEHQADENWADAEPDAVWLTADAVVLARCAGVWSVLLVRRRWDPFVGRWALPGGHVEAGETVEAATVRELAEETGLTVREAELRTVGTFHAPGRDPRGRYVTVASAVVLLRDQARGLPLVTAADDAAEAAWLPLLDMLTDRAPELGFDHAQILTAAADLVQLGTTGTTGGVR